MSASPNQLKRQTAVVTGSTSGIGRAIALELGRMGMDVVIHGREESDRSESLVAELLEMGVAAKPLFLDFGESTEHLGRFAEQAWGWKDGVDCWVNNAGADVLTGAWAGRSFEAKLDHLLQTDVRATLLMARSIGKRMVANDRSGSIVNMGWDQAAIGMEGDSGEMFATTKGAIMAMTKSLAQSLGPRVRVNCIAPGWIKTKWGQDASSTWDSRARSQSLADRWGTPEDVAKVAAFLCSSDSQFVSGQIVPVNGGFRSFCSAPE